MSELYDKLVTDMRSAMKCNDTIARDCIRNIISDIKNQTVNAGKDVTDNICIKAVQKSVKMHNDSVSQFEAAGRIDLAAKEKSELEVLCKYLPKMMDDQAIESYVKDIIRHLSAENSRPLAKKDIGIVMKALSTSKDASVIDMKVASKVASSLLSSANA